MLVPITFTISSWVREGDTQRLNIVYNNTVRDFSFPATHTTGQVLDEIARALEYEEITPPAIEVTVV
jgi:hypothetical protein